MIVRPSLSTHSAILILTVLVCLTTSISSTATTFPFTQLRQVDFNSGQNHRSHSVPGGPYAAFDHLGTKHASVILNGARSHTHYYNPMTEELGTIVDYKWVITTQNNRLVCTKAVCDKLFLSLGVHTVSLTVKDSTGDLSTAATTVTIFDGGVPSVRFLYYYGQKWIHNIYVKNSSVKANRAQTLQNIVKWNADQFITSSLANPLSIRVYAELDIELKGDYVLKLDCGVAYCSFFIDDEMEINSLPGAHNVVKSFDQKPYKLYIVWRLTEVKNIDPMNVRLVLQWMVPNSNEFVVIPPQYLSHRPGGYQPVIHALQPQQIKPDSKLTIFGASFEREARIMVGNRDCKGMTFISQFMMECQIDSPPRSTQVVQVITPYGGRSNTKTLQVTSSTQAPRSPTASTNNTKTSINIKYGVGYEQRINFKVSLLKKNGREWKLKQPTAVVRGPDDRYYFSRRDGSITVTEINGDKVTEICTSSSLNNRAVLGLAFNPADKQFKLYATSSIIYFTKKRISVSEGWKNGEIILFEKSGNCIKKTRTIISGIPVSAFDHSVNKLVFDNYGVLYFTVGSNTNAGVPDGETGNLKDSELSGTILSAPIMKTGFNGNIKYSNGNLPETANKISGEVNVYATGVRNSFGLFYHSSGHIYATDNGGNGMYGKRSIGCNKQTFAANEDDKLLKIQKGGFYGAANRARGQCTHYSAGSDSNNIKPEDKNSFVKYIATMEPATTGILEYTGNTFGGGLRGNLMLGQIATRLSKGRLYRVKLNSAGKVDNIFTLNSWSGADIAISGEGNLVMPQVYRSKIAVLLANEINPGKITINNVWPYRGPRSGGNRVTITGWGLTSGVEIYFNGIRCTDVQIIGSNGRKVNCIVPGGSGKVPVNANLNGQLSGSHGFEYMYMNF